MKINPGYVWAKFLKVINRPALRNCTIDKTASIGAGSNCVSVNVDRFTYMGKNNSIINADIGAFCSIASYCAIGGGGHDTSAVSTSPVFYKGHNALGINICNIEERPAGRVYIGNDVWIGEAVFIAAGVIIGDGAVIGAHSVVTRDIGSYEVVAGAPAHKLRRRFDDEMIEKLQKLEWWNWPKEKLMQYGQYFESPEELLKVLEEEGK